MKDSEKETLEKLLDSKEALELQKAKDGGREEAQKAYNEAVHDAWENYEGHWRPLREEWEAFQKPHFEKLQRSLIEVEKEYVDSMGELLSSKWPAGVPREIIKDWKEA